MLAGILRERALSVLRHSLAEVDRLRAGAGKKQSFLMLLLRAWEIIAKLPVTALALPRARVCEDHSESATGYRSLGPPTRARVKIIAKVTPTSSRAMNADARDD